MKESGASRRREASAPTRSIALHDEKGEVT